MMVDMADADEFLTASDVGVILGKSPRTVSRLAQSGELPHAARLAAGNGVYLFRRTDVDKYVAARAKAAS